MPCTVTVCLHGGGSGLDTLPWIPIARADSSLFDLNDPAHPIPPPAADPNAPVTESSVLHRLISPGGADGFPCSLECECLTVVYAPETAKGVETDVEDGKKGRSLGKLKVVMRAKIRQDGDEGIPKGTPVNLTVHWCVFFSSVRPCWLLAPFREPRASSLPVVLAGSSWHETRESDRHRLVTILTDLLKTAALVSHPNRELRVQTGASAWTMARTRTS